MTVLSYLLGALLVAGVVIAVLWYREQKPTSLEDGIDEFNRELQALAPEWQPLVPKSNRPKNGGPPG